MTDTERRRAATRVESRPRVRLELSQHSGLPFGTLAIGIALARLLGPEAFGTFAVATVALLAMLSFNELGVSLAIVRWTDDPKSIAPTVNTLSVAMSSLLLIAVYALAPSFSAAMGDPSATPVVRLMAVSILINGVVAAPAALLQRNFQQGRRMAIDQVNTWLGAAVSLALALAGLGAMSLAVGRIAGSLASAVLFIVWSPLPYRFGFHRSIARRLLHFGLPLAGASVIVFFVGYTDQLVVGSQLGATALGFYVLAFNLASWPVSIFSQPLRSVAPAAFARIQGDPEKMNRTFRSVFGVLFAVAIPACTLLAAAALPVVRVVYGEQWLPSAAVLGWLALAAITRIFFELSYDYLVVRAATRNILVVQILWLVALPPALLAGAHVLGLVGVAIAQVLVAMLLVVPAYCILLRKAGVRLAGLGRELLPSVAAGCAIAGFTMVSIHLMASPLLICVASGTFGLGVAALLVFLRRNQLNAIRRPSSRSPANMRVVVYPHDLGMGGSQINAIEIAAAVRRHGVEPTVFGRPGALNARIDELGLEFVEAPDPKRRPSATVAKELRALSERLDARILHGYEWPPALECYLASASRPRTSAVSTIMSMSVAPFVPRAMPLLVGTEQIAAAEEIRGRHQVGVLEPPVDLDHNVPSTADEVAHFRAQYAVGPDDFLVVCVTRLAKELKAEGLLTAMEVFADLPDEVRARLIIVGDGPARDEMHRAGAAANDRRGREVVTFTGQLMDPRTAYSAADAVIGMGGSALRALAFARPLIVQGERGFFELLEARSVDTFLWQGWYGVGEDLASGKASLHAALVRLAGDAGERSQLGLWGRRLVTERFSLTAAAERQVAFYEETLRRQVSIRRSIASGAAALPGLARYKVTKKLTRALGRTATDDFNSQPVAALRSTRPAEASDRRETVVYLAGVDWAAVAGTDHRLATALSDRFHVIWVDPPVPITAHLRQLRRGHQQQFSEFPPNITRIRPTVPPGVSRPFFRDVARTLQRHAVEKHIGDLVRPPMAVVLANAGSDFPRGGGVRCLYLTDDWIAGANLMGTSAGWTKKQLTRLAREADLVCGVTPTLLEHSVVPIPMSTRTSVLPNGCDIRSAESEHTPPRPVDVPENYAILIGQLNERLDIEAVRLTADQGLDVVIVGPRSDRDLSVAHRLDDLFDHPRVWPVGRRQAGELTQYLHHARAGLTPYLDTLFNRSSFPLKTLEYLAHGLPVVSSDLPASRWLDSSDVYVASSPGDFAARAIAISAEPPTDDAKRRRRLLALEHSWSRRAEQLEFELRRSRSRTLIP